MYPLIGVTIFDVVTRRFFVLGSTYLQEAEWHLHAVIVMLALGYAYLRNRQVRIDIFRAKWPPRRQAFVELIGCLLFMLPFTLILVYYGSNFSHLAWTQTTKCRPRRWDSATDGQSRRSFRSGRGS